MVLCWYDLFLLFLHWFYGCMVSILLLYLLKNQKTFKARPNSKIIFKITCSVRTPVTLMFVLIDLNIKLCFRNVCINFFGLVFVCEIMYMVHVNEESRSSQEIQSYNISNFVSYLKLLFLTHFGQWSYFVPPENPRFSEGIKWKHWSVMSSCF